MCNKEHIDILIPIRTDDQVPICNNLAEFEEIGTIPIINTTNPELMETALNKRKMFDYIKNVSGLHTLNYKVANNLDEFLGAVEKLGYPNNPIAIKPSHATGSRGFRILDPNINKKELFFKGKPNNRYSTLDEIVEILDGNFPEMLIMEYLIEPEFTIDVLCYKGKSYAIIPRKREKMIDGITVKGVIEKLPKQTNKYIEKIIESFGFSYSVGMQLRKSAVNNDIYHLMEINPRLQGTTVFSVAAGINILELLIDMAYKNFDFNFKPKIRYGLKLERTFSELFEYENQVKLLKDFYFEWF